MTVQNRHCFDYKKEYFRNLKNTVNYFLKGQGKLHYANPNPLYERQESHLFTFVAIATLIKMTKLGYEM